MPESLLFGPVRRANLLRCSVCKKGVGHGSPLFVRGALQTLVLDGRAIQSEHGRLEQFFGGGPGGAMLAGLMGTDPELAKPVTEPFEFWVCQPCALEPLALLHVLELAQADHEKSKQEFQRG